MKVVKLSILVAALTVALAAPSFAQTPPQTAPKPQTPPATAPQVPAAQPPEPKLQPQPPAPFPQDSKIAFVDIQQIASTSSAGKEASKKLQEFQSKKLSELQDKNKQVTALTTKRDQSGSATSSSRRATRRPSCRI